MISAKRLELKKMFSTHYQRYKSNSEKYKNTNKSDLLILFYAIECGLKSLVLKNNKKNSTNDFKNINDNNGNSIADKLKGSSGHDLKYLLRIVKIGNYTLPNLPIINNTNKVSCSEYNQVWRYGIDSDYDTEKAIEKELNEIVEKLEMQV